MTSFARVQRSQNGSAAQCGVGQNRMVKRANSGWRDQRIFERTNLQIRGCSIVGYGNFRSQVKRHSPDELCAIIRDQQGTVWFHGNTH